MGSKEQRLEQEHSENMTWQWKSFPLFVSVCVGGRGVCVCVSVLEGLHIAQGTNFSNGLIAGANEVRQESAELVNSWRACQMGWQDEGREHTHTCTHTLSLTSLSQCLMNPVRA